MFKFFSILFTLFSVYSNAQNVYRVNSSIGLKLRSEKSTNSDILQQLEEGTTVFVLEKDTVAINNYIWYKVKANEKTGYVASEFLTAIVTTAKGVKTASEVMIVNEDNLKLRSDRTITDKKNILYQLPKGAKVIIISKDTKKENGFLWYKVTYNNSSGYVASNYLSPVNSNKLTSSTVESDAKAVANTRNKEYWDQGAKIVKQLGASLETHYIASSFMSATVAADFRKAARQLRELQEPASLYPEIQYDIQQKITYLDLVGNAVDGSFSKYGESAVKYLVAKAIDMAPQLITKRGYMPEPDVVWLTAHQLEVVEKELKKVNDQELKTIQVAKKKYSLILKKW